MDVLGVYYLLVFFNFFYTNNKFVSTSHDNNVGKNLSCACLLIIPSHVSDSITNNNTINDVGKQFQIT